MQARRRSSLGWCVLLGLVACQGTEEPVSESATEGSSTGSASSTGATMVIDPDTTEGPSSTDASGSGTTQAADATSTTAEGDPSSDGTATTEAPGPVCGDGVVEGDEACDDAGESETCNLDCSVATCGDEIVNATAAEDCDGSELAGSTCETFGLAGVLVCTPDCTHDLAGCGEPPGVPALSLSFSAIKQFDFAWAPVAGADSYRLEESATPGDPFVQLGGDLFGESLSLTMPLHLRHEATYRLRACNAFACTDSPPVPVVGTLTEAIGYFKASNTGAFDWFGESVALSADGNTLAVGAVGEDGGSTGIGGDPSSNGALESGAVYVFVQDAPGVWSQAAYIKASNAEASDSFGASVALSADGSTLVVGAYGEDGVAGDPSSNALGGSGAAYVFERDGAGVWSQTAYLKASNSGIGDHFGHGLAISGDGGTLAVSAHLEDSSAPGIDGDQTNNSFLDSGAVYVFVQDAMGGWSQQAYVKASNPDTNDDFGYRLVLSGSGDTLVVGAPEEASSATGIDGNQADDSAFVAGAAYVFVRDAMGAWSQQAYVKGSNTNGGDRFGESLSLASDGNTLVVGASSESSGSMGIDGDQTQGVMQGAGAAYVLVRDAMGTWSQAAYVKSTHPAVNDGFGQSVAISGDGTVLAVGAIDEGGETTGVAGERVGNVNLNGSSGATYVYVRDGMGTWGPRSYVKASNQAPAIHAFGSAAALSADGRTLAVAAVYERSSSTGVGGAGDDDAADDSGAVYVY